MTAPAYCVLDGDGSHAPRRPLTDCSDMGGLLFQDALGKNAPRPNENPSAYDFKQIEMLIERMLRGAPMLQIDFYGSAITGHAWHTVISNNALDPADVDVQKMATGNYVITWPAGKLPTKTLEPRISFIMTTGSQGFVWGNQTGSSVEIFAANFSGSAYDSFGCAVDIYGE